MASDGTIKISTQLDNKNTKKALSKFSAFAKTGLKGVATAVTAVSTGLAGVSGYAIKVGADFEAQMSRVQAISGATGKEFEQLKNQAIELGADTAFSASEAAQGMENLASAGFTTNEIMSAMPGMLDLAAASGEDLANSADIAASTLRGFGLEASEAGHVADVLAENANRTNSSVAETGEAMKYIAPLARAAGISMEETAAAIGIMADSGIQGSQAGTTLRGALSRLSKPTNVMQQAMDELGVSFYDSEGKMLSLTDQVGMLQSAMEGMTDEQKNNYLVTLYGQEALSGMLALINEGPESLSSLTSAYESCDGAAQAAATTMQDNLKGSIEGLAGSAETLAILFYDKVSGGMKDAVQVVDESVDNITNALNNGGIDAAVKAAGSEFANLATEVAGHAPAMVNSAVRFIQSFASGIYSNRGKILSAAGNVATAFGEGLADLLPSSVSGPVKSAVREIGKSFKSGGLRSAISTVSTTFKNFSSVAGKVAKVTLPPLTKALDFAGENLDLVAASAAAAFTAFKGYGVITSVEKAVKSLASTTALLSAAEAANALQVRAASGALTAKEMIVGVLTGKIKLATVAQMAWNAVMNANPIGLLITAIGALTAGIGVYVLTQKDSETATDKANKKLAEQAEAIRETQAARKEEVAGIQAEYGHYQQLWNELQGIVDQNGKVKEGYEERAAFITSTLSDALGVEIEMVDGVIQEYGNLTESIDQVIQKKKAEALIDAYMDDYTEALKKQGEAAKELSRTYDDYSAAKKRAKEADDALKEVMSSMTPDVAANSFEVLQLSQAQAEANKELDEAKAAYNDAKTASEEYSTTIANVESAMGAAEAGSENASAAVLALSNDLKRAGSVSDEALKAQVDTFKNSYDDMQAAVAEEGSGVTQEMANQSRAMWLMAQIEYEKGTTNNKALIEQWQAEINALLSDSGSPEAAMQEGREITESMASGISSKETAVKSAASGISTAANIALGSANTQATGQKKISDYSAGVSSKKSAVSSAALAVSSAMNAALGSANTGETGRNKVSEYSTGVSSKKNAAVSAASAVSASMNIALSSVNTKVTGQRKGEEYASGIRSKSGASRTSGKVINLSADEGARSKTGYDAGSGFGAGFASGIQAWVGSVVSSAANLAASALAAAKRTINSNSPAKETIKLGKYFGQGFELGIQNEETAVEKASKNLAESALHSLDISSALDQIKGLDVASVVDGIYDAMSDVNLRITDKVTSKIEIADRAAMIRDQQMAESKLKLSNEDIKKLAKEFGMIAGNTVSDRMKGMKFRAFDRDFARVVEEAKRS